jgi:hypothetical protein
MSVCSLGLIFPGIQKIKRSHLHVATRSSMLLLQHGVRGNANANATPR